MITLNGAIYIWIFFNYMSARDIRSLYRPKIFTVVVKIVVAFMRKIPAFRGNDKEQVTILT